MKSVTDQSALLGVLGNTPKDEPIEEPMKAPKDEPIEEPKEAPEEKKQKPKKPKTKGSKQKPAKKQEPKPKRDTRISIALTEDLAQAVKDEAWQQRTSVNSLLVEIIDSYIKKQQRKGR